MKIKKEIDKRQETGSDGHPVSTVLLPKLTTQNALYTQIQNRGKTKDFLTIIQRQNKLIFSSHLQTSSKHTLGQNILSYNLEGAIISLNSLTFSRCGTDSLLRASSRLENSFVGDIYSHCLISTMVLTLRKWGCDTDVLFRVKSSSLP